MSKKNEKIVWTPNIISAKELCEMDIQEPDWVIEEMIAPGLTILAGPPKAGKTRLATNWAFGLSKGSLILDSIEVKQCGVLFICLEDSYRTMKDRIEILNENSGSIPDLLKLAMEWERVGRGGLGALDRYLNEHSEIKLVIIDVLGKFRKPSKNNNNYDEDLETGSIIKEIADRYSISIIANHHFNKRNGETDFIDRVSGTSGLTGAADTIMALEREMNSDFGTLSMRGREVKDQVLSLRYDEEIGTWYADLNENQKKKNMHITRKKIIEYLEEKGKPLRAKEISTGLKSNSKTIRGILRKMIEKGQIKQNGKHGLYFIE